MSATPFDPEAFGAAVGQEIRNVVAPLLRRIEQLEDAAFHQADAHESGKAYSKGALVKYASTVWRANYKTASRPGDGQAWTTVKLGKDAR
jgi:hypothetical protein